MYAYLSDFLKKRLLVAERKFSAEWNVGLQESTKDNIIIMTRIL